MCTKPHLLAVMSVHRSVSLWGNKLPYLFGLLSKLAQFGAEVTLSTSSKLSRGAPEPPNLRLKAAPSLPDLSFFREFMWKSGK